MKTISDQTLASVSSGVFHPDALRHPLLIHDLDQLLQKLHNASGLLGQYRDDFQNKLLKNPDTRNDMIFLAALMNQDLLPEASELLLKNINKLLQEDTANDVQFHTWCRCGQVTRQAVFFDWLATREAWSEDQIALAADSLVGFAFNHTYMVLNSRARASDNQAISMALNCAIIGFVFGHKLAKHPTAQFLFDYGLGRLPDLVGLLPQDGYGGEGSTYVSYANTPLLIWTASFLKQLTGKSWIDTPFAPNQTTLRNAILMEARILSPGGLLAPWDHYGWLQAVHGAPFAFLADMTHDPRYLSIIPALTDTTNPGSLAWGSDDPMWTLIWWPQAHADHDSQELHEHLFGWFLPRTGAALDDLASRSRLMQVWDASGSNITSLTRAHCDPNHVLFEYDGQPVFQDGIPSKQTNPWPYTHQQVFSTLEPTQIARLEAYAASQGDKFASFNRFTATVSPGLIGASNAIVVDDEPWYWPGGRRVGTPTHYSRNHELQMVSADSAAFYQPHYDITRAIRTSAWSKESFGLIHDQLQADSPHQWQWQVHTRPMVTLDEQTARIDLPDGQHILLAWLPGYEVRSILLEGFPSTYEQRSVRLELRQHGRKAEFIVLIAPNAKNASIRPLRQGRFEIIIDQKIHHLTLLPESNLSPVHQDIHGLSDITVERDLQFPDLQQLIQWTDSDTGASHSRLRAIDSLIAQLKASSPDDSLLQKALSHNEWSMRMAAVITLGLLGQKNAIVPLREMLKKEHAIAPKVLYPSPEVTDKDSAKRWRLKAALITALGRLRDQDTLPLLETILRDNHDFYPVYSAAAQAIGRIGGPHAGRALSLVLQENEVNTHARAKAALAHLQ